MNTDSFSRLAGLIKAAADPLRLMVLKVLQNSSYGVLELSDIFQLRQSGMSHHLKVLAQAGWVETRKEGNTVFYRTAVLSDPFLSLQTEMQNTLKDIELPQTVQLQIRQKYNERIAQTEAFFNRHASQFRKQQDLIAEFSSYRDMAAELLFSQQIRALSAVEIGPGTGEFLPLLSHHFDQVRAYDISADMLGKAASLVNDQKLSNVELCQGTIFQAPGNSTDAVIYNMVLHHVPDPAEEIRLSAGTLREGGSLLITELCSHTQSWAKENCGDLWLGFQEKELMEWAQQSGLIHQQTIYAGLRNGFQIQCLLFQKPENA